MGEPEVDWNGTNANDFFWLFVLELPPWDDGGGLLAIVLESNQIPMRGDRR